MRRYMPPAGDKTCATICCPTSSFPGIVQAQHRRAAFSSRTQTPVAPGNPKLQGAVSRRGRSREINHRQYPPGQLPCESLRHYGFPPGIGTISSPVTHTAYRGPGSGRSTQTTPPTRPSTPRDYQPRKDNKTHHANPLGQTLTRAYWRAEAFVFNAFMSVRSTQQVPPPMQ